MTAALIAEETLGGRWTTLPLGAVQVPEDELALPVQRFSA
jgi:hypothetical protein